MSKRFLVLFSWHQNDDQFAKTRSGQSLNRVTHSAQGETVACASDYCGCRAALPRDWRRGYRYATRKRKQTEQNETKCNKKKQTGHRAECFGQDTLSRLNVALCYIMICYVMILWLVWSRWCVLCCWSAAAAAAAASSWLLYDAVPLRKPWQDNG
eukprot:COSAG06_NODE_32316_length_508_cov_0.982885_1_plen_154_part_01